MIRNARQPLTLIASLTIAALVLGGCASPGYERTCDWCDDASKEQLKRDVAECNAIATSQVPYNSITRKTGRIVTSHGTTTCTKNKRGEETCTTGKSYTYPEEETVDITNYGKRKNLFTECTDLRARTYRPKVASTNEENYNWDLKTPPEKIEFTWTGVAEVQGMYYSMNRNSIQANGKRRVFWVLIDQENKRSPKVRSSMTQIEIDCLTHRMRALVVFAFPEPMGKGELIGSKRVPNDSSEGAWTNFSLPEPHFSNICAVP